MLNKLAATFSVLVTALFFSGNTFVVIVEAAKKNRPFTVLEDTFAFCGLAQCWIFNQVAYCACKVVKNEPSISATLETEQGLDVGQINSLGDRQGGYMISTFYYGDKSTVKGEGDMAVYSWYVDWRKLSSA